MFAGAVSEPAFGFSTFGLVSSFDIRHSSFKMTADMDSRLAIDTAVLLLYLSFIISIGLYMGRREESLKDFVLGVPNRMVGHSRFAHRGGNERGTFFEHQAKVSPFVTTLIFSSRSARSRTHSRQLHFHQAVLRSQVYSIYEYLTARFGVGTKNAASAVSYLPDCSPRRALVCRSDRACACV